MLCKIRTVQIQPRKPVLDQIDHDLDHLDPNLPLLDVVQDICTVQIQPRKPVVFHADYAAPTRLHEL